MKVKLIVKEIESKFFGKYSLRKNEEEEIRICWDQ
jgi:hypothetical protein